LKTQSKKNELLELSVAEAKKWLSYGLKKKEEKEINNLLIGRNEDHLIESFHKKLEFGTGGMRGLIGIGSNRINSYTISLATQGLCNYLKKTCENAKSAVIAYDSRRFSKEFGNQTAKIFSANNIKSYIFSDLRPTPELSFAVRELNCSCGIVITASHNPKEYNGYKVYWNDGGQITSPHDKNIISEVEKITDFNQINFNFNNDLIDKKYIEKIQSLSLYDNSKSKLKIIFSSLHGTGITQIPHALKAFGFKNVISVKSQELPDPEFSTVHSPNPEDIDALDLGIKKLIKEKGDILIATDPDSDRVGVALNNNEKIKILNGNQLATLIVYYSLINLKLNKMNKTPYVAKTIVTTRLIDLIARDFGVKSYSTLTGFKYIAELIKNKKNEKFIAGGEESYGYLVDEFVRDKDAIISCAFICEIANWAKENNKSLNDIMDEIYDTYGLFIEKLYTIKMEGIKGTNKINEIMERFRTKPPQTILGDKVKEVIDYNRKVKNPVINVKSNVIQLISENNYSMTLRQELNQKLSFILVCRIITAMKIKKNYLIL
jgi:phosphoglucomutase